MDEQATPVKKFQWKWVGISMASYLLFYMLPIAVIVHSYSPGDPSVMARTVLAVWSFAGIFIIAAIVGYVSEGVTLWEPACSAASVIVLLGVYFAVHILSSGLYVEVRMSRLFRETLVMVIVFILLSLLGAWFGERAQKLWRQQ
ncbi:MAG: hypothetical protein NTU47_16605 [Ignavibacteriales bacterium]|nr:hypothetical protein [Ignavibacteriales bacterium]